MFPVGNCKQFLFRGPYRWLIACIGLKLMQARVMCAIGAVASALPPRQQQGTETGARWFTEPAHSVDDPFGLEK